MATTTTTTQVEQQAACEALPPVERRQFEPVSVEDDTARKLDRGSYCRLGSAGFAFFVAGINDGSIGALVPYIIRDYKVDTAIVTAVYGANFMGWFVSALTNTHLCQRLQLGSMLLLGAVLQILGHALRVWRPPFPLFVVTFFLASLGQAYQDTHGNTFVATFKGSHRLLAFIHSMYMAGCLVGPFVATGVASASEPSRWELFYSFPLGIGVANVALVLFAFRKSIALKRKPTTAGATQASPNDGAIDLIKETLMNKNLWLIGAFFFLFLGATLTASGWVVEYLVTVRDGDLSNMGYVSAGFSGGSFLGRALLAEPTYRLGTRRMIFIYTILCIGLQLVFWLVPNIIAASIAVSLLGFFIGPYFVAGIDIASKVFEPRVHSTALAFVFVFAQIGGCIFPIVTGLVALNAGVTVLQPMLCALLVATAVSWVFVPNPKDTGNPALHGE